MARSYGLKVFGAETVDDLTEEQYRVLVTHELEEMDRLREQAKSDPELKKKEKRTVVLKNVWD